MAAAFSGIPVLDLSKAAAPATKPGLLQELRHALLAVGFLYVTNHGVPESAVQDVQDLLPRLFRVPEAEKREVALINSPHFLGYSSFGSEVTAKQPDHREQFEFASTLPDVVAHRDHGRHRWEALLGPNQWPQNPPDCRAIVETYLEAMTDLSLRFLRLVAEAFGLPADVFLPFVSHQHRAKLVHYRPSGKLDDAGGLTQGVGPHKDSSGWLTFLLQGSNSSVKGLQVLNQEGTWIDVPPIHGTFVVNVGQAFEVLTHGVSKATIHRVLLPPGNYDRYSVPFFQGIRLDITKDDFKQLWEHFDMYMDQVKEIQGAEYIDAPFLAGKYNTWGESQLRTKIRSHQDVGKRFYADVFTNFMQDDA